MTPAAAGRAARSIGLWSVLLLMLLQVLFAHSAHAQQLVAVPPLERRVTDLTGTLSPPQMAALEAKIAAFEARKGSQVAVLLVPTTQPEAIEQYSLRVAEAWKIGRKKIDDGVILVVAKDDRALRIEVGYGLEGALPDAIAKRIVSEVIVPQFRAGDFAGGIEAGVDRMIGVIDGEPLPAPKRAQGDRGDRGGVDFEQLLVFAIVIAAVGGGILRGIVGKGPAAGIVGTGVGILAWAMSGALLVAIGAGIVAMIFTLLGGAGGGFGSGRRGGWSSGGGGWSSGGGGGGWSGGGGGGFGGGGASGRW